MFYDETEKDDLVIQKAADILYHWDKHRQGKVTQPFSTLSDESKNTYMRLAVELFDFFFDYFDMDVEDFDVDSLDDYDYGHSV